MFLASPLGRALAVVAILSGVVATAYLIGRRDHAVSVQIERAEQDAKTQSELREFQDESRRTSDDDLCNRLTGGLCAAR